MRAELLDLNREELTTLLKEEFSLPPFRARQLIVWAYRKRERDFSQMTDMGKTVQGALANYFQISRPKIANQSLSADGTRKYLFKLSDGNFIESVLIKNKLRYTLCISSQVGCALGCKFCRTALIGLKRNLQTHEIVGQVLAVKDDIDRNLISNGKEDFQNIVFMGMGEPLHSLDSVARAIGILGDDLGLAFSPRKITVSTVGLAKSIRDFADRNVGAMLTISLNATTDEVREKIMPINKRWPLDSLLSAAKYFNEKTSNYITMGYVMLGGVNDTDEDLKRIPKLLHGINCKINLIPYNENAGLEFQTPKRERVEIWQKELLSKGLNTRIRWSKGEDVDAACGQLAYFTTHSP